jgi:hypothetical protein
MPISIFDYSATNSSAHNAMEAYTHAMQAYALSQVSFFDLSENFEIRDKDSDDVPTKGMLYQGPGPPDTVEADEAAR